MCLCLFSTATLAQLDTLHKAPWYKLKGFSLMYAGGFGMIAGGIYFNPLKNTEFAFSSGYTPKHFGGIWTINSLLSYNIWKIKLNNKWELHPINTGGFLNLNIGKNIYLQYPAKYPDEYYWWNSAIRYGPFVLSELKYFPDKGNLNYKVFFQTSTNDLYIASYGFNRSSIYLHEILVYGFGMKAERKNAKRSFIK